VDFSPATTTASALASVTKHSNSPTESDERLKSDENTVCGSERAPVAASEFHLSFHECALAKESEKWTRCVLCVRI
jgi:hypothetical protein